MAPGVVKKTFFLNNLVLVLTLDGAGWAASIEGKSSKF